MTNSPKEAVRHGCKRKHLLKLQVVSGTGKLMLHTSDSVIEQQYNWAV